MATFLNNDDIINLSNHLSNDYDGKINVLETKAATSVDNALTAAKAYTSGVSAGLSTDYVGKIDTLETKAATSADNALTTAKAYTDGISTSLSTDYVKKMSDLESKVTTSINSKITIDSISNDLSIMHISQNDYHQLVVTGNTLSTMLYVVSAEYLNMYDEQIKNLAEPTESADATTKNYVDAITTKLSNDLSNDYYKRSETSSATELSQKFNVVDSEIGNKRDLSNLSYRTDEWNCYPPLPSGYRIMYIDYAGWVPLKPGETGAIIPKGDKNSTQLEWLSSEWGGKYEISATRIYDEILLSSKLYSIKNDISTKIFIQNDISGNLCAEYSNLSVLKVSKDNWETSVLLCSDAELSNILFVISSDYIDAYGQSIFNVGFPDDDDDRRLSAAVPYWKLSAINDDLSNKIVKIKNNVVNAYADISTFNDSNDMEKIINSYLNFISSLYRDLSGI